MSIEYIFIPVFLQGVQRNIHSPPAPILLSQQPYEVVEAKAEC